MFGPNATSSTLPSHHNPFGGGAGPWGGPQSADTETITVTNVVSAPAINKLGSLFSSLNKTVSGALNNFIQQQQHPNQQEMTSHLSGSSWGGSQLGTVGGPVSSGASAVPPTGFSVFGQHMAMPPRGSMIAPADIGRPSSALAGPGVRPNPQVAWMQHQQQQQPYPNLDPTNSSTNNWTNAQGPPHRDASVPPPSNLVGHSGASSAFVPVGQGYGGGQQIAGRGGFNDLQQLRSSSTGGQPHPMMSGDPGMVQSHQNRQFVDTHTGN